MTPLDSETKWCADLYDQCAELHEARARAYREQAAQLRRAEATGEVKPLRWHDPLELGDPGRADGWRFLLEDELLVPADGEVYSPTLKRWTPSQARRSDGRASTFSYRTKQPLP